MKYLKTLLVARAQKSFPYTHCTTKNVCPHIHVKGVDANILEVMLTFCFHTYLCVILVIISAISLI